jgi:SAM-dependent methyltransferase
MSIAEKVGFKTTKDYWEKAWKGAGNFLVFDPTKPWFSDLHRLLTKNLPCDPSMRCLEIGCYPGTYMWYFNKYFGYQVTGVEYVDSCIEPCRENMRSLNLDAEVIHADMFSYAPDPKKPLWDVVTSFGLIEHFDDTKAVIQKHLDFLKPGGYLVLVIPNHSGLNGQILKALDQGEYNAHNRMSYERMEENLKKTGQAELIEGGYYGHIGFWNAGLYSMAQKKGRLAYTLVRAPLYVVEHVGRYIVPNTQFFAPNSALIARKI